VSASFSHLLNHLDELAEFVIKLDLLFSLSLFLLQFVHVVKSPSGPAHVQVVGCDPCFFEELDVCHFSGAYLDGRFQGEMDYDNKLVFGAWLEKGVLDVGENDVYIVPFD